MLDKCERRGTYHDSSQLERAGDGCVAATAVTLDPLNQLGRADLPFRVVK